MAAAYSPTRLTTSALRGSGELLVDTIEQLAILEACLWHIHEAVAANSPFTSFFCREYWGTSASQAQLSLEKLLLEQPVRAHVQMACALESLSLGVISHQSSRVARDTTGSVQAWLCNLVANVRGNCLVLLSLVRQQWIVAGSADQIYDGHCPANLDFNILSATRHFRQLCGEAEHVAAINDHNVALWNALCQLCKPGFLMSDGVNINLLDHGLIDGIAISDVLLSVVVDTVLALSTSLACFGARDIRGTMLRNLRFCPALNSMPVNASCPAAATDPYQRFGSCEFATDGPIIWFEPLPPVFTDLSQCPRLPPAQPDVYTLVLDLDETLVHHSIVNGASFVGFRPGVELFLRSMSDLGFEMVIYTAATQNYADACIDMVDPNRLIIHRLYRQHALSWGPIYVKDLSRIGRDLNHTLIIDNIADNFMLQPHNGIYIYTWIDDPTDTALTDLIPVLRELVQTRSTVPAILEKYREHIPLWAGWKKTLLQAGADGGTNLAPANATAINQQNSGSGGVSQGISVN